MKIEPISNGNLRIWLADKEIEEWGLEDTHGAGVRRLVRRALAATGRRLTSRMWAEMIPVDGGCVVLVSPAVHRRCQPVVYAVAADALVDLYARYRHLSPEEIPSLQLYEAEEGYWLVAYGEEPVSERMEALLREYGQPLGCGEGAAAHAAEYGTWLGEITAPAPALPAPEDRLH